MSKWIYASKYISSFAQGVTRYCVLNGENSPTTLATGTEAVQQLLCRGSYTASNLWCNVTAISGTLTLRDRKNGANGGQAISITTTGTKEDTTNTTSLSDGDLYCLQGVQSNSHGDACTLQTSSVLLDDAGSNIPIIQSAGVGAGGTSANQFNPTCGSLGFTNTLSEAEIKVGYGTTLSRMRTYLTSTSTGEFDYYFDGVAGTQALSYSGETGAKEDTTATDIVASGERWSIEWIATGGCTIASIQEKSSAGANLLIAARPGLSGIGASVTNYYPLCATLASPATTESNAQIKTRVADTFSKLQCNVTANSRSDATTVDFRKGATSPSGGPAVSVASSSTGIKEDTTGTYTSITTDLINYRVATGGGTGTITITTVGVQQGTTAAPSVGKPWPYYARQMSA